MFWYLFYNFLINITLTRVFKRWAWRLISTVYLFCLNLNLMFVNQSSVCFILKNNTAIILAFDQIWLFKEKFLISNFSQWCFGIKSFCLIHIHIFCDHNIWIKSIIRQFVKNVLKFIDTDYNQSNKGKRKALKVQYDLSCCSPL